YGFAEWGSARPFGSSDVHKAPAFFYGRRRAGEVCSSSRPGLASLGWGFDGLVDNLSVDHRRLDNATRCRTTPQSQQQQRLVFLTETPVTRKPLPRILSSLHAVPSARHPGAGHHSYRISMVPCLHQGWSIVITSEVLLSYFEA